MLNIQATLDACIGTSSDEDGAYGAQCCDRAMWWARIVTGRGCITTGGGVNGAADYATAYDRDRFTWIDNAPDNHPLPGDLVIWNRQFGQGYGHVAICETADVNTIWCVEQDGFNQVRGTYRTARNYYGVMGWLRPKALASAGTPAPVVTPSAGSPIYGYWDVDPGDTLTSIAEASGTTVDWIVQRNGIQNPDLIYVGQRLALR